VRPAARAVARGRIIRVTAASLMRLAGEFQAIRTWTFGSTVSRSLRATPRWYPLSVSQPSHERIEPSPNAERLRIAMGWDRLPEMSPERAAEFEAELARHDEEVRRYYGKPAA
jgi:hypothetical protein